MRRLGNICAVGLFALGLLTAGCDDNNVDTTGSSSGACTANQAQIAVYDGFLQNLCGCQEASAIISPPNALVCTIPAGTTVFFFYIGTKLMHQLISTNSTLFQTSPLSDPNAAIPVRNFYVTFSATGTYEFEDQFNNTLNGDFIVQ